jgi:uncharacterized membrane protein
MQNPPGSRDRRWIGVLLPVIGVYSAIFSIATIWKHYSFNSFAWDLGTFDQVQHYSVFEGVSDYTYMVA